MTGEVHIFGDSHTRHFEGQGSHHDWHVHWNSKTMYGVGRDGLGLIDFVISGVPESSIAVIHYGEIDCRTFIGRFRDSTQRPLGEMLDELVTNYIRTILQNKAQYQRLDVVVCEVPPPTDENSNELAPYYGHLSDRVEITRQLNARLREECPKHGLYVLDLYPSVRMPDGTLDKFQADCHVHVRQECCGPLFTRLQTLLDTVADAVVLGSR